MARVVSASSSLLLALAACGGSGSDTVVAVTITAAPGVPTPDHLLFTWMRGERSDISDRRIPEVGTLAAREPFTAQVRVDTVVDGERRVAIVRAIAGARVYAEGAAAIPGDVGTRSLGVVLRAGTLVDADRDGIPDEVDACVRPPSGVGCTSGIDGGVVPLPDGAASPAADAALPVRDAASGIDAPAQPDGSSTGRDVAAPPDAPEPCVRGARVLIDDFDSRARPDRGFFQLNCYIGSWYTYGDGTPGAVLTPGHMADFVSGMPGYGDVGYAAHVVGSGFTNRGTMYGYAGMGINLNAATAKVGTVDASAFAGVRFRAKGTASGPVRVDVVTDATADPGSGGACAPVGGRGCNDHHGVTIMPTATWASYEVRWDAPMTMGFAQGGWGVTAPFSATKLVGVHWQVTDGSVAKPAAIDLWIDDLAFIAK